MRTGPAIARLLVLAGGLLLAACATASGPGDAQAHARSPARLVEHKAVASRHVRPHDVTIALPPGYDGGKRRYRVLYMHDGQNLFDPAVSSYNKVWAADRAAAAMDDPPIIVGIWNAGADRGRHYLPARVFDRLPAKARATLAGPDGKPVLSDSYLRFLVEELKPMIDRDYRTRPGRADTAIMGSSMGGLISLYAIAEYPQVFGAAGCLSTHFPIFVPTSEGAPALFADEVKAAWASYLKDRLGPPDGRRIWFDHGTETLDAIYAPYQAHVDALLPTLGWQRGKDFVSTVFAGTPHEENAWAARLPQVMRWVLDSKG